MKLTDEVLIEIGFNYSTVTKQFTLLVPNGPQITVYNKQVKTPILCILTANH